MNTGSKACIVILFSFFIFFSSQLLAAPWTPVKDLSGWEDYAFPLSLKMNGNGDQVAFWAKMEGQNPNTTLRILANIKYQGQPWGEAQDLSGPLSPIQLYSPVYNDGQIAPDGTAWIAWTIKDTNQATNQFRVKAAHCPPGGTWIIEDISNWEVFIRSVDLSVGPNGDVVIAWVSAGNELSDFSQGPSSVCTRRCPSSTGIFNSIHTIATYPSVGCSRVYSMVGPTGIAVVVYGEAVTAGGTQWHLRSQAYNPGTGLWDSSVTDISGIIDTALSSYWYAEPVMSEDSTVITAWVALTTIGGALEAQYSSTRNPSNGTWSTPAKISGDFNKDALYIPLLATRSGTTAAIWVANNTPTNSKTSVFGAARDPGGVWQTGTQISAWEDDTSIQDLDIWPTDGTIMALWEVEDNARATGEDEGLFWSARTPSNSWGSGGSGQLDTWYDSMKGSGLVMGADGTAVVVFGVDNTKKSATLPGEVRYVKWPPAGPWETPRVLVDSLATVSLNRATVASTTSGLPVSTTWCAIKSITDPLSTAIWQSQMGDNPTAAMPAVRSLLLD